MDGGRTYSLLKEGETYNSGNNHWHNITYDPYSDGVWASQGDGDNSRVYYTTDWGATWQSVLGTHPTDIFPFEDKVVFGRDKTGERPGMDKWMRNEGSFTQVTEVFNFRNDKWSFNFYPSRSNWYSDNPDVYYILYPPHEPTEHKSYVYGTGDGGDTWHLIYNGDLATSSMTGIDKNGYVYGIGSRNLYRSKAVKWN